MSANEIKAKTVRESIEAKHREAAATESKSRKRALERDIEVLKAELAELV